ncbi:MAG: diguanylate cyclase [Sulfuricurvum sp.]|nr:diguanylate cyclase [Sulfuricurvum sp.]
MVRIVGILVLVASFSIAQTLTFGVLEYKGKEKVRKQYQPLADYIAAQLHTKVTLEILSSEELERQVRLKKIDIVATNPTHFISLRKHGELTGAIATEVKSYNGIMTSYLGGVIFTRSDRSDIRTLSDIRFRTIAFPGKKFLGGYQVQNYELSKVGVHLPEDAVLLPVKTHGAVVERVLAKKADIGFVRTGTIEELILEHKLKRSDISILNEQKFSNFPWMVSTNIYPEWAVATRIDLNDSLIKEIAAAIYTYVPKNKEEGRIEGFTIPADYTVVDELARELHIPPYENAPDVTLHDIWEQYNNTIYISFSLSAVFFVLIAWLYRRNSYEKVYARSILDASPNPTVVTNGEFLISANKAMLTFLGYATLEAFKQEHRCVCDFFEEGDMDEYLQPKMDDKTWINYILAHPEYEHKAKMTIEGKTTIFKIDVSEVGETNQFRAIAVFTDISLLLNQLRTDPLTHLYNRLHFDLLFEHAMHIANRDHSSLSVIFFDIDHFKQVNDIFGHLAGDEVLRQIAKLVKGMLRQSDIVARWGGEEFIILLPNTGVTSATQVAENLRMRIEQEYFHGVGKITCSFGVTTLHEKESADSILSRVDELLYNAKGKGRNQTVVG